MKIVHSTTDVSKKKIMAADNVFDDPSLFDGPSLDNDPDEVVDDAVAENEDMGEEGMQDGSTIEVDNNIFYHLIAECQNCHGIFISAMVESDQATESINGVCPLCSKNTEQFFIGVIDPYPRKE